MARPNQRNRLAKKAISDVDRATKIAERLEKAGELAEQAAQRASKEADRAEAARQALYTAIHQATSIRNQVHMRLIILEQALRRAQKGKNIGKRAKKRLVDTGRARGVGCRTCQRAVLRMETVLSAGCLERLYIHMEQ